MLVQSLRIAYSCIDYISATANQYVEESKSQGSDLNVGVPVGHPRQLILVLYYFFHMCSFFPFVQTAVLTITICLELFFSPPLLPLHLISSLTSLHSTSFLWIFLLLIYSLGPIIFTQRASSAPRRWFAGVKCLLSTEETRAHVSQRFVS